MRITQLIPGTGHFFCGSCLRDEALARALRRRGHDVTVVPLYLPLVLEQPDEDNEKQVLMGGINMYLQQKSRAFARLPRWIAKLLDAPGLLRFSAARGSMTDPGDVSDMVLSLLRGEDGRQSAELDQLVRWMTEHERPDLICISNVLLAGMVRRLKQALDVPVICTLQGEAPFLDELPPPARAEAWRLVKERAAGIDAFVAVSGWYGALMADRLGVAPDRLHVVYNGIDLDGVEPAPHRAAAEPPTIGYLARMCRDKGLPVLVDAFCALRRDGRHPDARLHVAGVMLKEDRPLVKKLRRRLRDAGLLDDVTFSPNIDRDEKWRFLRSLSVLSVPATYGESFGLYVIEALAAGVPVVQPRHGAFPELIEATGGGLLCEPDDASSLAEGLATVLADADRARALGERGRQAVHDRFTSDRMALEAEKVCMMVASTPAGDDS
ncbi:MAG: glycosyltransferase family 4 protein [Planctomycetota bacterium]